MTTAEERQDRLAPDPTIARLVDVMNVMRGASSVGITLLVRGQTIGGQLVSGHHWWQELTTGLRAAGTAGAAVAPLFDYAVISYEELLRDPDAVEKDEPEDTVPTAFLHLMDAYLLDTRSGRRLGNLRIRLADVSGWSLASIAPDEVRKFA